MPTTIKSESWDGVTAPAIPSGWANHFTAGDFQTSTSSSVSAPNSLEFPESQQLATNVAYQLWQTQDAANGNVRLTTKMRWASAPPSTNLNLGLMARFTGVAGQTSQLGNTGTNCYILEVALNAGGNTGLFIIAQVNGTDSIIAGPSHPSAFTFGIWYSVEWTLEGSSHKVRIQRDSDSKWLDNTGTWVTDPDGITFVIDITNGSVTGSGYAGVFGYANGGSGTVAYHDDFLFESIGGPLLANTCFVSGVSSTSVSVSADYAVGGAPPYNYQYQHSADGSTGWTNTTTAQSGVAPGTAPDPFVRAGLTAGVINYYRCVVTDSADPVSQEISTVTSFAPHTAATHYVDIAGNDSNDGVSAGTPWATLDHASKFGMVPGDTLLLKGSQTHTGSLLLMNVPGTYPFPMRIGSYGTGRATVSCGDSYGIRLVNCRGVRLSDVIISGSGASASGGVTTSTSDSAGLEVINSNKTGRYDGGIYIDNVSVEGCFSGIDVRGHSAGIGTTASGYNDVRITGCDIEDVVYVGIRVACIPLIGDDGLSITWDQYDPTTYWGVNHTSTTTTFNLYGIVKGVLDAFIYLYISDCSVLHAYGHQDRPTIHSGSGITVRNCRYGVIERSVVRECGINGFGPAGIWYQECRDSTIRFCEADSQHTRAPGVDGDGFDLDGGVIDCTIEYCYSHDCDGAGYLCGPYTGGDPPIRSVFRYCVSLNDGRHGLYAFFPYSGAQVTIHNCLAYSTPGTAGTTGGIEDGGVSGIRVHNNIWITTGGLRFYTGSFPSGVFTGNLYFESGGAFSLRVGDITYSSWASYLAAGYETIDGVTVGLNANPLLSDITAYADRLPGLPANRETAFDQTLTSPTVNKGLDLLRIYGIQTGQIDFHEAPNRDSADSVSSGYDIGPTKYGALSLLPGGTGGGDIVSPAAGNVRSGISYGAGGTEFVGNLALPVVGNVRTGISYGSNGTEFTGTLVVTGGTGVAVISRRKGM